MTVTFSLGFILGHVTHIMHWIIWRPTIPGLNYTKLDILVLCVMCMMAFILSLLGINFLRPNWILLPDLIQSSRILSETVGIEAEMVQRLLEHGAHQYILPEFSVQLLANKTTVSLLNVSNTSAAVKLLLTSSPCVCTQRPSVWLEVSEQILPQLKSKTICSVISRTVCPT